MSEPDSFALMPIMPPDPKNERSVREVLEYLQHGRIGPDSEEDPYYIDFMKKARKTFVRGVTAPPVKGKLEQYDFLVELCREVAIAIGIEWNSGEEMFRDIASRNSRILAARAAQEPKPN